MKILCAVLSALLLMAAGYIIYQHQQTSGSIALLNVERIITESAPGKASNEHLRTIDQRFQQGMNELYEAFSDASEEEKQRVFSQAEETLVRQFAVEERNVREAINSIIGEEAEKWRQKHRVSMILPVQITLASHDTQLDATDDILAAVNQRQITFAEIPQLNIMPPAAQRAPTMPNGETKQPDNAAKAPTP